jgi:hypothetical protein
MPLSSDPEKRAAQLANLRPNAATRHGVNVEARLAPLRERYLAEQRRLFPSAGEDEVTIQASRLAQMEVLQDFLDRRGPIRHQRQGQTFAAADLLAKVTQAYERRRDLLAAREERNSEPESLLERQLRGLPPGGAR